MKKIALMLAMAVVAIACQKEEKVVPQLEWTNAEQIEVLPAKGGAVTVGFTTNMDWTATVQNADWCTLTPASGFAGDVKIRVSATANESTDDREAILVIKAGENLSKELKINQLQKNALLIEGEKAYEVPMEGGEIKLTINHNVPFTLEMPEWIEKSATKAMEKEEVLLLVEPQKDGGEERVGKVIIKGEDVSEEITIKQAAFEAQLLIEVEKTEIPRSGGEVTFTVKANLEFKVEGEADWGKLTNKDNRYTFKANGANEAFAPYQVILKFVPVNEKYAKLEKSLVITQEGKAKIIWYNNPIGDVKDCTGGDVVRLAQLDNLLLMSNTNKVFAFDLKTGKLIQTLNLPSGQKVQNICNDDKGNILICSNANGANGGKPAEHLIIFRVTDLKNLSLEKLVDYNTANLPAATTGNIRVKGDLDKKAVITATASGAPANVLAWEVVNGKLKTQAETQWGPKLWMYTQAAYTSWGTVFCCALPVGNTLADGFFFIGYGGDYSLNYLANPTNGMSSSSWVKSHRETGNSNDNFSCLSSTEFNGKKYLAYTHGAHFNYSVPTLILMDVSDPAKAKLEMKLSLENLVKRDEKWQNTKWTGTGAFSDVKLCTVGDKMYAFFVDTNFNILGAVEFVK